MIQVPTPQSILDDTTVDILEIPQDAGGTVYDLQMTNTQRATASKALWHRFASRPIGHTDTTYWRSIFLQKVYELDRTYALKMSLYDAKTADAGWTDLAQESSEGTVVYEHEDTPSTALLNDKYLSTRDTTTTSQKYYEGTPQETLQKALDAIGDPYRDFAREFDAMFTQLGLVL